MSSMFCFFTKNESVPFADLWTESSQKIHMHYNNNILKDEMLLYTSI